jgi:hypothetical protein
MHGETVKFFRETYMYVLQIQSGIGTTDLLYAEGEASGQHEVSR